MKLNELTFLKTSVQRPRVTLLTHTIWQGDFDGNKINICIALERINQQVGLIEEKPHQIKTERFFVKDL